MATKTLPAVRRAAYRARATIKYLCQLATLEMNFTSPNSLQQWIYQKHVRDADDMKQRLLEVYLKSDHTSTIRCYKSLTSRTGF